ncbi:MAG: ComF family protein [Tissierellaceae bacterium]|nr:ComF family protein [Tissierellaceae bacterium]
MEYIKAISSLLFPTKNLCYLCKETKDHIDSYICSDCLNLLQIVHKEVDIHSSFINKAYYTLIYNRYIRDIVADYKFNKKSYLYKPLGELMLETIREKNILGIDLIMYIPSHRRKEAQRGYNQAELLATYIGKQINIEVSHNNLVKLKYTRDQNKLNRFERLGNLYGSFKVKNREEIKAKRILLIDDIITTGATMEECSKELIKNEAKEVLGLALTSSKKL